MFVYVVEYSYEDWVKSSDRYEWGGTVHKTLETAQARCSEDARKELIWEQQDDLLCGKNWTALAYDYNKRIYRVIEIELQD